MTNKNNKEEDLLHHTATVQSHPFAHILIGVKEEKEEAKDKDSDIEQIVSQ